MIFIFHGDNQSASRTELNRHLDSLSATQIYRFEAKNLDANQLNLIINSPSLIPESKAVVITTPTAIPKNCLPLINSPSSDTAFYLWHDRALTAAQLKAFPQSKVYLFKADNRLFSCLNTLRPGNISGFTASYQKVIDSGLFDLFLYFLKGTLRRQLTSPSGFPLPKLKSAYLQLIEMEHLYKSGQLSLSKDIALQRIILNLIK